MILVMRWKYQVAAKAMCGGQVLQWNVIKGQWIVKPPNFFRYDMHHHHLM